MLSHGYWMRRFGGSRSIVGTSVMLNDQPTQIVGVMPLAVAIPDARVDVWVADQVSRASGFGLFTHSAVARLRPEATAETAAAEMTQLVLTLGEAYPGSSLARSLAHDKMAATPLPLKESVIGNVARALWTILGAVGLVLLVACANVANLFLVRSDARQREVAVRRALGAGSRGLVRFYLAESVLLSAAGGALGLGVAWMAVRVLVRNGSATLPRLHEVQIDTSAALVAIALSLVIAVTFALIPLLHRTSRAPLLREGRGQTAGRQRHRMRHALMAAQVALALVLLVASALMVRSFQSVRALDPGFNPDSTLTFRIALESRDYAARERAVAVHHAILERLQAIPGVAAASASTTLPLSGMGFGNSILVQRRADEARPSYRPVVSLRAVAGGYFETAGMRILRGRALTRDDVERREPAVVVSQAFADAYFPNEDPIGRQIASSRPPTLPPPTWLTIVGVVANTPSLSMIESSPLPQLYMPMSLAGAPAIPMSELVGPNVADMSFVVRIAANPLAFVTQVRAAVDAVDRNLALSDVRDARDDPVARVGADGFYDGAAGTRRGGRAAARRDRHLRCHGLHREPAHQRDRTAPGAGRGAATGDSRHCRAGWRGRARRHRHRADVRAGGDAADCLAALRRQSARPGDLCRDGRHVAGGGGGRLLAASSAGGAAQPGRCSANRVAAFNARLFSCVAPPVSPRHLRSGAGASASHSTG